MRLTNQFFWDQHWRNVKLPIEIKENTSSPYIREILKTFKKYLPIKKGQTVLEIGGAPGGYLAYMARSFGYSVYAIDNSYVGHKKLEENFRILNIPITAYQSDIMKVNISDLPQFDIVYSLGLIEHFLDPLSVIHKHIQLTKPSGILLLGVPNFLGVNRVLLRIFNPDYLSLHNLSIMNLKSWNRFEDKFGLEIIFKDYIGGWEPRIYIAPGTSFLKKVKNKVIGTIAGRLDKLHFFRRLNSMWWSGYAIGVYRKINK